MANKSIFSSFRGALAKPADTVNAAGAPAYSLTAEATLARLAVTGCFNGTFYSDAQSQLDAAQKLAAGCDATFVAKLAVYARTQGRMKDFPALLVAILATRDLALFAAVFPRVIDDAGMLRAFVRIVRSGVTGRKSLGSMPKRLVRTWLDSRDDAALLRASVGTAPSLADIVKMTHPRPASPSRAAFYAWLIGRNHDVDALPVCVRELIDFRAGRSKNVPDVDFRLLTGAPMDRDAWVAAARRSSWNALRQNLNTFSRHGVFDAPGMTGFVAGKLRDADAIRRAKVFPYAIMTAFHQVDATVPAPVKDALQDALDIALANVPALNGKVVVCPDISGSMHSPVTGHRKGATSTVKCLDAAALIASAMLNRNRGTLVLPFSNDVLKVSLNPRDSVMTNARLLASLPSGGTNCSAPLNHLVANRIKADLVILVSDNESWIDARNGSRGTATLATWKQFKLSNPKARLVCLDIQPNATTQAPDSDDVLNIGGFSDDVFTLIADVAEGRTGRDHWVGKINAVNL